MSKFLNIARTLVLVAGVASFGSTIASGQVLSKDELKKAIASASAPADHERIAKHYDAKAAEYDADAKYHAELAAEYTKNPNGHEQKHPNTGLTASHCKAFAEEFTRLGKDARQLAADHRAMAKPAK